MKKIFKPVTFVMVLILLLTLVACGAEEAPATPEAEEATPSMPGLTPSLVPTEGAEVAYQITEASEQQTQLVASLDEAIAKGCEVAEFCEGFWEVWSEGTIEQVCQLPANRSEAVGKLNEAKGELQSAQAILVKARKLDLPDWYQDYLAQREQAASYLGAAFEEADRYLAEITSLAEIPSDALPAGREIESLHRKLYSEIAPLLDRGDFAQAGQELSDTPQRIDEAGEVLDSAYEKVPVPVIKYFKDRVEPTRSGL